MANALLSWSNHVDAAGTILAASATAGNLSISNVASPIIGRRWRTTDLSAHGQADFATPRTIGVVALAFPRDTMAGIAGQVRHLFDGAGGNPGGGAVHDSGLVDLGTAAGYGYHVYVLPAPITARYWRFAFAGIAGGSAYVDVGRAWAGEAWQPAVNFSYGAGDGWRDLSVNTRSARSGARYWDRRPRLRTMEFALNALTDADRRTVRELTRIAGTSEQVLHVRDPDSATRETILGPLLPTDPIRHASFGIFSKSFSQEEDL